MMHRDSGYRDGIGHQGTKDVKRIDLKLTDLPPQSLEMSNVEARMTK